MGFISPLTMLLDSIGEYHVYQLYCAWYSLPPSISRKIVTQYIHLRIFRSPCSLAPNNLFLGWWVSVCHNSFHFIHLHVFTPIPLKNHHHFPAGNHPMTTIRLIALDLPRNLQLCYEIIDFLSCECPCALFLVTVSICIYSPFSLSKRASISCRNQANGHRTTCCAR